MENKKVIYGAPNHMEYQATIKVGKATLKVSFTGGNITAYGVNPATFQTNNPIYQMAIENSALFKAGRIIKMGEIKLDGESPIKVEGTKAEETEAEAEETAVAEATEATEAEAETEKTVVKVSDYNEAKEYLADTFGIARHSLRSQKQITETAERYGIVFEGLS